MEIYKYTEGREYLRKLLQPYMEKHLLIPYIGAGFSKKVRTRNGGYVPSGWDLHQKMVGLLQQFADYSESEAKYYLNKNLNDFADVFLWIWRRMKHYELNFKHTSGKISVRLLICLMKRKNS